MVSLDVEIFRYYIQKKEEGAVTWTWKFCKEIFEELSVHSAKCHLLEIKSEFSTDYEISIEPCTGSPYPEIQLQKNFPKHLGHLLNIKKKKLEESVGDEEPAPQATQEKKRNIEHSSFKIDSHRKHQRKDVEKNHNNLFIRWVHSCHVTCSNVRVLMDEQVAHKMVVEKWDIEIFVAIIVGRTWVIKVHYMV